MNIFKQFKIALYQFDQYSELTKIRGLRVFLYEVLLFLITTAISMIPFIVVFVNYGGTKGIIEKLVPDFKIENGILSAETSVFDENGTLIILDGNNKRESFELQNSKMGAIFDQEKIIAKNGMETNIVTYKDLLSSLNLEKFEKADIFNYISEINMFLIVFIALSIVAVIISEATGIFLLSLFALIMNLFLKKDISYKNLLKFSVYVRTLSSLLTIILALCGFSLDFIFIVALNFAYLFFAIKKYEKG